ncbi:6-phosphogluconolactonase [Dictyobacter arantiisoli]|uniref:6-phosphogluconolactonase n=1 Tax=Dictyobacter arantiisoli TaxID=2014874 RepID=A0A5A5T7S0_9CHLR|nr:6-phosphogluconolactonase [Dictyobacter arantiisoli]GCF07063.1 6-phosphogluconolactonase [Dictyobacter arantiisoli]
MDVVIFSDVAQLSEAAAEYIVRVAQESIAARGRFMLALSGGSTPRKLYAMLAEEPYRNQIDWSKVEFFWSDERCVPSDDAESNYHLAQQVMLSKLQVAESQIHRVPADEADRDAASLAYAQEMQRAFGTTGVPRFDLIQLGMGPEGHTASLFPHQASLEESDRLVMPVTVPKPPPPRLTFTPVLLNAAIHTLFLVTGAEKEEAVQAVIEGPYQPEEYPAQIVRPTAGEVTWMFDTAAAARLSKQK